MTGDIPHWQELSARHWAIPERNVLGVRAGTDVLARIVAKMDARVTGLDPSARKPDQGRAAPNSQIDYRSGDTHAAGLFESESFDMILSWQPVC